LPTALQACSTQANTAAFWQRLPLPVQQAAPFVGAATLSALIMNRIGSAKLRAEVSCELSPLTWLKDMIPRVLFLSRLSPFACTPIGLPDAQRERNQRLRGRLDILLNENEELHAKVSDLKVNLDAASLCKC